MIQDLIGILIVAFTSLGIGYIAGGKKAYQKGYNTAWVDRQIHDGKRLKDRTSRSPNGQFTSKK